MMRSHDDTTETERHHKDVADAAAATTAAAATEATVHVPLVASEVSLALVVSRAILGITGSHAPAPLRIAVTALIETMAARAATSGLTLLLWWARLLEKEFIKEFNHVAWTVVCRRTPHRTTRRARSPK